MSTSTGSAGETMRQYAGVVRIMEPVEMRR